VAAVSYSLFIDDAPASPELLAAIQQIEVEDHADLADMLRLRISICANDSCSAWTVIDEDLFPRLAKIQVSVAVGSAIAEPLIEAYVIETNANFANQPGQSILNVVAMDATVLMSLEEKVKSWPDMSDSDIANAIFTDQAYNFVPDVETTTLRRQDVDQAPTQRGTDLQFLRDLARRNGFEVYVETNPLTRLTEGHFHPPRLDQTAQGVLSINFGEATNVNSFNARFDMLGPTSAQARGLNVGTLSNEQAQADSISLRALGRQTSLDGNRPRRMLLTNTGLSEAAELQIYAQAVVDSSSLAITGEGQLNTVAYGKLLRAKRPVLVRGAGSQFNGTYYVRRVLHTMSGDSYAQNFTLHRNATGLSGEESFIDDLALPS